MLVPKSISQRCETPHSILFTGINFFKYIVYPIVGVGVFYLFSCIFKDITRKTPETYRKRILKILTDAYPNSISKKDFPTVKLVLNHIRFDIVPAYTEKKTFGGKQYFIPARANDWRSTVPNDINFSLTSKNKNYGGNIIRNTIRLCKHWNAMQGYPFQSYLMEKDILDLIFWGNENTYERFLKTLNYMTVGMFKTRQVLKEIEQHKGSLFRKENIEMQFKCLQRLLPGLR